MSVKEGKKEVKERETFMEFKKNGFLSGFAKLRLGLYRSSR